MTFEERLRAARSGRDDAEMAVAADAAALDLRSAAERERALALLPDIHEAVAALQRLFPARDATHWEFHESRTNIHRKHAEMSGPGWQVKTATHVTVSGRLRKRYEHGLHSVQITAAADEPATVSLFVTPASGYVSIHNVPGLVGSDSFPLQEFAEHGGLAWGAGRHIRTYKAGFLSAAPTFDLFLAAAATLLVERESS